MNINMLKRMYLVDKLSAKEIATISGVSTSKVHYWLNKHAIKKRSQSESAYCKYHKNSDPFNEHAPQNNRDYFLLGVGLGLYWGEGTKANKNSVRLGNTDPDLIRWFMLFLEEHYTVPKDKLKFGLQLFHDLDEQRVKKFWIKKLNITSDQFYKTTFSPSQSQGTYSRKTQNGVLTIYFNNTKLRNLLVNEIDKLRES